MAKESRGTSIVVADDGTAIVEFVEYENDVAVYTETAQFINQQKAEVAAKSFMSEYSDHDIFGDYEF